MPSSEECLEAAKQIKENAIKALIRAGHSEFSAEKIVGYMSYNEQVQKAEKILGPIYRGPYSPY